MKFGLKNYYKPTPKTMRKIGDYLLWVGGFLSSSLSLLTQRYQWFIALTIIIPIIGKAFTNLFAEDDTNAGK